MVYQPLPRSPKNIPVNCKGPATAFTSAVGLLRDYEKGEAVLLIFIKDVLGIKGYLKYHLLVTVCLFRVFVYADLHGLSCFIIL